ncbi:Alpha-xylosidase [Parageobacillus caldoxylosilyticus]|uniref:glycoside hydrolase family 31 protein n=1 Tax=Saccharococcus caldoxylosilyticus TaxID=81408 RepID=UPI001C4E2CAA|nr:glycoside hydrolase family 31 protein [Parageobacillus caldoxylosilyticus]QXJ37784.1 Alpha-xylosidase [Parageobacillus caldoxylosilyticus]
MHTLTDLREVTITETAVELYYAFQAKVLIRSPQEGTVQVQFLKVTDWSEEVPEPSYSVLLKEFLPLQTEERENEITVSIPKGRAVISKVPFGIRFFNETGREVTRSADTAAYQFDGWKSRISFQFSGDERIYGLGESDLNQDDVRLNHRGTIRPIWNKHLPSPSRLMIPVIYSSEGYGLFVDNPWVARFDFGVEKEDIWFYEAEGGTITYYLFLGQELKDLVSQYVELTGRPEIPPLWTFGYLQSKFGYKSRQEVEELAETFRQKRIPCDSIILDLYWFKKMGDMCFDRIAFPQPEKMIAGLRGKGFHPIVIEEPYVTKESRLFPEGDRIKVFAKKQNGETYLFPFWAGESALVDFTDPFAKQWWADQHKELIEMGIEGWWTDLNEPEVHSPDMVHHDGPAQKVHNIFALEMHKSLALAHEQNCPERRLFIMSRSGWAGSQRYGVGVWSGDVESTWTDLKKQLSVALSMSLVGLPLWNSDIGGFKGNEPSPELYVRWIQFGAFTPIMRPHGAHQNREPWAFGEETEKIVKNFIEWRYRFLPYIYSCAFETYRTGIPYMRPMVMEVPEDLNCTEICDQFFIGSNLLVAPVLEEGATSRKVYLPEGLWYDVWTWQSVEGGRTIEADAPLDRIPIYAKAGSIIPTLPVMQHAEERSWDKMTIIVYPGRNGEFLLYEDDGKTTAYKRGEYRTMSFSQKNLDGKIIVNIGAGTGSYPESVEQRTYHILIPGVTASEVRMNGKSVHSIKQEEGCLAFTLEDQPVKCEINVEIVINK